MKKIIPFKKDIILNTNIAEITSISLDHTLHIEDENLISGTFIVSGEYKMTEASINVEPFSYELPFDIAIDDKYDVAEATVDINDFYYEIINDNVLSVNIEVVVDGLEEPLIKEPVEELEPITIDRSMIEEELESEMLQMEAEEENEIPVVEEVKQEEPLTEEEPRCIEPEDEKIGTLFDSMDDSIETYQSYKVYIVRDGDTLDTILEKYSIAKEELECYNDLKEIHIGDKIIIPTVHA